jgi:ribosome recycling factor
MYKLIPVQTLRNTCTRCCRPAFAPALQSFLPSQRTFTTTPRSNKKASKASKLPSPPSTKAGAAAAADAPDVEDPHDFSALEESITLAQSRLKDDLSKLRSGGRFNPELIESLRVSLDKTNPTTTTRLSDICQVLARGRTLQLLAGDPTYLKPITSAILTSDLSLTPQTDPQNALQLNIPLPPPTKESRNAVVAQATKAGEKALDAVRMARQGQQKRLRSMGLQKSARPDDIKKAGEKMEKVVEKGNADVKRAVDASRKVLESG